MNSRSRRKSPRLSRSTPGSGFKRHRRIDAVLEQPDVRALLEEGRHRFAVATGVDHLREPERHLHAALPAVGLFWRVVDVVVGAPGNANLPREAVYHYVLNRAYAELTAPVAEEAQRRQHYLSVALPPGRPPTRHNKRRQELVEELRARPDMADYMVQDRAIRLGVWTPDQANDSINLKRRIRRLRQDAAKLSTS